MYLFFFSEFHVIALENLLCGNNMPYYMYCSQLLIWSLFYISQMFSEGPTI